MGPLAEKAMKNQETEDAVEFYPPRFNQTFYVGWKMYMTGLFRDNYGGATKFLLGITKKRARCMLGWKSQPTVKTGFKMGRLRYNRRCRGTSFIDPMVL